MRTDLDAMFQVRMNYGSLHAAASHTNAIYTTGTCLEAQLFSPYTVNRNVFAGALI